MQRSPCQLWIEQNMPRLDARLSATGHIDRCRVVLNNATGLDVAGAGFVDRGMAQFHRALLAMTPEQRAAIEDRAAAGEL